MDMVGRVASHVSPEKCTRSERKEVVVMSKEKAASKRWNEAICAAERSARRPERMTGFVLFVQNTGRQAKGTERGCSSGS